MRRTSYFTLNVVTAAFLATAMAGPADARRYRHWDRHDGIDVGDVIVGAIIIGGIAAIASEINKSRENNGTVYGDRDRNRNGSDENAAVKACSNAAEERAYESGRSGRVADITSVDRAGRGYRVRGIIEYYADKGWENRSRNQDYGQDEARFSCSFSYGQVDDIWIDDGRA